MDGPLEQCSSSDVGAVTQRNLRQRKSSNFFYQWLGAESSPKMDLKETHGLLENYSRTTNIQSSLLKDLTEDGQKSADNIDKLDMLNSRIYNCTLSIVWTPVFNRQNC